MAEKPTLEVIATHLGLAVRPLREAVADLPSFKRFMAGLGWEVQDLPPAYTALGAAVDDVVSILEAFGDGPSLDQVLDLLGKIKAMADAIAGIATAPAGVDATAFLADVGERILEVLLVDYLTEAFPFLARLLELLDVISYSVHEATPSRPARTEVRFKFAEIPKVIADPASIPARIYGWGTPDLDFPLIAGHLRELLLALRVPATVAPPHSQAAAGYQGAQDTMTKAMSVALKASVIEVPIGDERALVGVQLLELPAEGDLLPGVVLQPMIPSAIDSTVTVADDLRLDFRAGSDLAQTFGIVIRPGELGVRYPFQPGTTPPSAGFAADLTYAPAQPTLLLGSPGGTRLQAAGAKTGIGLDFAGTEAELHLALEIVGFAVVLAAGDQDGFLGSLFGGKDTVVPLPLGIKWSSKTGLAFSGSAKLDVTAAPHLALGPIVLDEVQIALVGRLESGQAPKLEVTAAASISGALGPVAFTVSGVGVSLDFVTGGGNAGPFGVDVGFKPPSGAGIAVSAGPITGGGFLRFEPENHRYEGMLQLQIYSVAVTAIGLLDTSGAGEAPAYSFLLLISTEFPPIQLGYGFTLNGVGGLAGIHRTVVTEALRAGIKNHSVDHVLFPDNPVRNATQIISDLRTVFPPARGRYVFGPMAIIGWGTPTLIEAELGVILELPAPIRIILLGQISVFLPRKEVAIVELHIDILGILDVGAKLLSIDGTIYDSHVAMFSITGDMAFRFCWGEPPIFALSLGGLNPRFQPPPGFPTLARLTIALGNSKNPRIGLQAYFAITANSLQLGALAEVYAEAAGFNIYGWVGFDVLVTRSPLSLTADLSGGVALRRKTREIAGVHLDATLTGPTPWRAKGEACLSLLFFDITVPFDHTFGDGHPAGIPGTDPWPELLAALEDPRSWNGEPAVGVSGAVSRKAPDASAPPDDVDVMIDPAGAAVLRQRVLPLDRQLTRLGAAAPVGTDRFTVNTVRMGDALQAPFSPVQDYFAPAQFEAMTDDEKLSRPSFELMDAGVRLGGGNAAADAAVGAVIAYETIVVDTPWTSHGGGRYNVRASIQNALATLNLSAKGGPSRGGLERFVAPGTASKVALGDETYVIAGVDDLGARLDLAAPGPPGAVALALKAYLARAPGDRGRLQVVPLHETEAAA